MRLRYSEVTAYERDGYVVIPECFSESELRLVGDEAERVLALDIEGKVLEDDSVTVRSVNGAHLHSEVLHTLGRHPRLLEPARQLLNDEVYIHQFKINAKRALAGDVWHWHHDYVFWHNEDGMPDPRAINFVLFLDDVTEFNGPMLAIPGTHRLGLEGEAHEVHKVESASDSRDWHHHTSKQLKYTLDPSLLQRIIGQNGVVSVKGARGSILIFHCCLFDSSGTNNMPWDRRLLFVTYNSVSNRLLQQSSPRPSFMANRDFSPLTAVPDDALMDPRRNGMCGRQPSMI